MHFLLFLIFLFLPHQNYAENKNNTVNSNKLICLPPLFTEGCSNQGRRFPYFITAPVKSLHDRFFRKFFQIILDKAVFFNSKEAREKTPFNFQSPENLKNLIDFELKNSQTNEDELLGLVEKIIEYSPRSSNPFFMDRRNSGLDPYGLVADWTTVALSTVMLTYLYSPVFSLMEIEFIKNVRNLIGYTDSDPGVGGIETPFPNGFALQLALQNKYPDLKKKGFALSNFPDPVIFVSEDADYTIFKSGFIEGIRLDAVIKIKTDQNGRMDVQELKKAIDKSKINGKDPLMIFATAGTPILGAIDPIDEIAQVAQDNKIWLHIDGDCGGGLIFSENKKVHLKGMEKSNSFSWAPHCLLSATFETNFIFARNKSDLQDKFSLNDPVYFKSTILYNESFNLGDATIQTSRRANIFKIWYMWKIKGKSGFENHVDYIYKMKDFAVQEIKNRNDKFSLILNDFDLPLISFNYIPDNLRGSDRESKEFIQSMNTFTDNLKNKLLKNGISQISYSTSTRNKSPNFLTMNLKNSAITENDIKYILDQIEASGENRESVKVPEGPSSYPDFVTAPIEPIHGELFRKTFDLLLEKGLYFLERSKNEPALDFKKPENLYGEFDVFLENNGINDISKQVFIMENLINKSSHLSHPDWFLLNGLDPYAIAGDILVSTTNTPTTTYEDAPVYTLMENEIMRKLVEIIGYKDGEGEGIITPGASIGNMYAFVLAKQRKMAEIKNKGNKAIGKKLIFYMSVDAHYSLRKSTFYTGIGMDNCVKIPIDRTGKMIPRELENAIQKTLSEGGIPFLVAATSGTTILGAIDPLEEIANICKRHDIWFHIDGAFGGVLMFSDRQKPKVKGTELADSFVFNPTKILASPPTMTCFMVKKRGFLKETFGLGSSIDFSNESSLYDKSIWDNGDKQYQRVRKADVLKFWLAWKAKGTKGFGDHIDYVYEMVDHTVREMRRRSGFEPFLPRFELTNVLFMYVPRRLRRMDRRSEAFKKEMENVSFKIQAELVLQKVAVMVAQRQHDSPLQLKFVFMSSGVTRVDVNKVLREIDRIGRNL